MTKQLSNNRLSVGEISLIHMNLYKMVSKMSAKKPCRFIKIGKAFLLYSYSELRPAGGPKHQFSRFINIATAECNYKISRLSIGKHIVFNFLKCIKPNASRNFFTEIFRINPIGIFLARTHNFRKDNSIGDLKHLNKIVK